MNDEMQILQSLKGQLRGEIEAEFLSLISYCKEKIQIEDLESKFDIFISDYKEFFNSIPEK